MINLLRRLVHEVAHELGTGRALENARHEVRETAGAAAAVDALAARLATAAMPTRVEEPVAA